MYFLSMALVLAIAATAIPTSRTVSSNSSITIPKRLCGVTEASPGLIHHHKRLRKAHTLSARASPSTTQHTIDTVFHIISTSDQAGTISRTMVANQFGALQAAYASNNISFRLLSVDFHTNDTWATNAADTEMKSALRRGTYSTLNIYFQTNLSTTTTTFPGTATTQQLLGFCTLPTNITYAPCTGCAAVPFPASNYALDGCNVHAGSMPNGPLTHYNQGKTAVHEVGHWFGLLHTFQDTTCAAGDAGDFIDDTSQEAVPTDGCPVGKNSCPDCPGLDPVHNYMDYSSDACYETFSRGQIERMKALFGALRDGF